MQPLSTSAPTVRFADFVFDPEAGELRRGDTAMRLGEKPAAALFLLTARAGEVVGRSDLIAALWPDGTFVDFDNNLNAAIKKLRDALGDDAERPRFIETLPRKGYRFLVAVEPAPDAGVTGATEVAGSALPPPAAGGPRRRGAMIAIATVALLSAVLAAAAMRAKRDGAVEPVAITTRPASETAVRPVRLAVLPFEDLGAEPAPAWLRDGLAEELITQLGRLRPERLAVLARHSALALGERRAPPREVGRDLDVELVLTGSLRRDGERYRVTVQLARSADEAVLWADRFQAAAGELHALEARVTTAAAAALARRLLSDDPHAGIRAATLSERAYRAYREGRHAWHRFGTEDLLLARTRLIEALDADPTFAPARAALADTYNLLAFTAAMDHPEAFAAAEREAEAALDRDPALAMAHNALAFARLYGRWDLDGALEHFARAIELDPNYAMAHHWHAGALAAAGRHDRAIAAMERSLALDPLSLSVVSDYGWYLIYADRYERAIEVCTETLERSPGYGWAVSCLREAYRAAGRDADLIALLRDTGTDIATGIAADIAAGPPPAALAAYDRHELSRLQRRDAAGEAVDPRDLAALHARLGELEPALTHLERAFEARDPWLLFVAHEPVFDPLHGDARFTDLLHRIGVPAP